MRPDGPRDPVAGPDGGPEPPYPIGLSGPVIKGFGRGSKEVGIMLFSFFVFSNSPGMRLLLYRDRVVAQSSTIGDFDIG
jgi:hypothetical protein